MSSLEEQDFGSDSSEDEDFIPDEADMDSDEGASDDDDGAGSDVGGDEETTEEPSKPGKRKKQPAKKSAKTKKRKSGLTSHQQQQQHYEQSEDTIVTAEKKAAEAEDRKRRIDALWEVFNAPSPSSTLASPASSTKAASLQAAIAAYSSGGTSTIAGTAPATSTAGGNAKMVTITMTYDFAGEKVTVTKEVPENSKEAKDAAAKGLIKGLPGASSSTSSSSSATQKKGSAETSTTADERDGSIANGDKDESGGNRAKDDDETAAAAASPKKIRIKYVRAKSRLDDLAALYGVKKPAKLNTLEKSKLDWNSFVGKEGIEDELKHHNKDGYMEKTAFLERTYAHKEQEIKALRRKR